MDKINKQQSETTTQINNPPTIELRQECFVRRCDQTITGRDLRYNRALEIIQDEEYLSAADFDEIKR